jgi:hypothetical protein
LNDFITQLLHVNVMIIFFIIILNENIFLKFLKHHLKPRQKDGGNLKDNQRQRMHPSGRGVDGRKFDNHRDAHHHGLLFPGMNLNICDGM